MKTTILTLIAAATLMASPTPMTEIAVPEGSVLKGTELTIGSNFWLVWIVADNEVHTLKLQKGTKITAP